MPASVRRQCAVQRLATPSAPPSSRRTRHSARIATCAPVVAPRTTSTGRAGTSLCRTCPSCAWPLQRQRASSLCRGALLGRGVKWTRGGPDLPSGCDGAARCWSQPGTRLPGARPTTSLHLTPCSVGASAAGTSAVCGTVECGLAVGQAYCKTRSSQPKYS